MSAGAIAIEEEQQDQLHKKRILIRNMEIIFSTLLLQYKKKRNEKYTKIQQ